MSTILAQSGHRANVALNMFDEYTAHPATGGEKTRRRPRMGAFAPRRGRSRHSASLDPDDPAICGGEQNFQSGVPDGERCTGEFLASFSVLRRRDSQLLLNAFQSAFDSEAKPADAQQYPPQHLIGVGNMENPRPDCMHVGELQ